MNVKACRDCHLILEGQSCPNCKSTNISDDLSGLVIIIDPKNSIIARTMGINKKGKYATRVR